ncbi:MAG: GNAT family N-acetyltransferase [Thermomicrobiales bacterium]
MLTEPIETDRLRIRRFARDDWQAVHAYTADAGVMTYRPEGVMTEEQTRQFVAEQMGEDAQSFAVDLLAEDRLIGHMDFHPWFGPRTYEIGWCLNPRFHGQGYATEAAAALLRYGFETLRLHRIIATCQPENVPSWRVMEKLGMRREAHFRKAHLRDETTWWDEYFYALLAEEWFRA